MIGSGELNNREHANQPGRHAREVKPEDLVFASKLNGSFRSTQELTGANEFVGQERALAALELGFGIGGNGYNIFVSGLTGAAKLETLRRWVAERAAFSTTPGDSVYVHNFEQPDAPRAISLKPGEGKRLKQRMQDVGRTLREELPKAFRHEAPDKH